ncbi:MAG: hypothetical protein MJZ85_06335 [Bacteroidales bacterium]|nr:hypothetical protein [Bacteroidales bacterium]
MPEAVLIHILEGVEGIQSPKAIGGADAVCYAGGFQRGEAVLGEAVGNALETVETLLLQLAEAIQNMLLPCLQFRFLLFLKCGLLHAVQLALHNEEADEEQEHQYENDDVLFFTLVLLRFLRILLILIFCHGG